MLSRSLSLYRSVCLSVCLSLSLSLSDTQPVCGVIYFKTRAYTLSAEQHIVENTKCQQADVCAVDIYTYVHLHAHTRMYKYNDSTYMSSGRARWRAGSLDLFRRPIPLSWQQSQNRGSLPRWQRRCHLGPGSCLGLMPAELADATDITVFGSTLHTLRLRFARNDQTLRRRFTVRNSSPVR